MDKVYVFGHRNPDTDSVTAAISLAYLKRQLGINAVPIVLSSVNLESKYVLDYFKEKEPKFLNDVKLKVRDLNFTRNYFVSDNDSLNTAYFKMTKAGISKIPVLDNKKKLMGIITMKDIAKEQFSDNVENVKSSYDNILEALNGEELLRFDELVDGKLIVAGYRSTTIMSTISLDRSNIMLVGDRHSIIEYAVNSGIQLLIVTGGHNIKEEHIDIARKNKVNIIVTPHNTLIASRRINLANNIGTIDYTNNVSCVKEYDNVSDFVNLANKTRYSYYPVINEKEQCVGILRTSDVSYDNKKNVILVDHNSFEQSAIGLSETNILEIVDHHNIGSVGTNRPINFRNMPVGSTNTIIYTMFKENNVEIPSNIAGLMLSGILSDTLILNSPTTTDNDRYAVSKLSKMAGVDYKEYGLGMLKAGSSLKGKTKEEVLYTDYKVYPVMDGKIGLGQLSTTNPDEILDDIDEYVDLLNSVSEVNNYIFVALFVTDVIKGGSYVLSSDKGIEVLKDVYKDDSLNNGTFLEGVVSRKSQILPGIMVEMGESK